MLALFSCQASRTRPHVVYLPPLWAFLILSENVFQRLWTSMGEWNILPSLGWQASCGSVILSRKGLQGEGLSSLFNLSHLIPQQKLFENPSLGLVISAFSSLHKPQVKEEGSGDCNLGMSPPRMSLGRCRYTPYCHLHLFSNGYTVGWCRNKLQWAIIFRRKPVSQGHKKNMQ